MDLVLGSTLSMFPNTDQAALDPVQGLEAALVSEEDLELEAAWASEDTEAVLASEADPALEEVAASEVEWA